jgi:hypothetical protein
MTPIPKSYIDLNSLVQLNKVIRACGNEAKSVNTAVCLMDMIFLITNEIFATKVSRLSEDALCRNTSEVVTLCNVYNVAQTNIEV